MKTPWPSDRSPEDLVSWVIQNPPGWKVGIPRWAAVADCFGHGSGISIQLCRWAGVDPNEIKRRKKK